ncbi:MAG: 50S ribosomal protein L10 [Phycisphaeraceae bacterium]|nr:50S ribosomal protein L10 [Phycisphaeraceae bacterium]
MSKPVKNLITDSYKQTFDKIDGAVLIDIRGIDSKVNNELRAGLLKQQVKVTVVKNSLAKKAFAGTALEQLSELLEGPSALVYGGGSVVEVARTILEKAKQFEKLQVKGAVMDGTLYPANQVDALSKFPTKAEAQGQIIQIVLSPAGQVIGAATSAGSAIASILKTIEEKLEKGEAIAKAS